ncbi:MAG: CoA transferase [Dehalococcoidia bacterium]|nr:CoA transferase [Dehalococcoidia bacterium]
MTGALDGIRIVDFGQYIAGPMAAMLLADNGADVVRVDPPSGPSMDVPANVTWNRGKRSIALDLKAERDLGIARRLIEHADVVIENFRPGVMGRLGLGAEVMSEANPRLIYCSMPGFAGDDPRAQVPAWEGVIAAASGTFSTQLTGGTNALPIYTAVPIASVYAAFQSAVSVTMALNARDRDGAGQRIEVPLFDGMFAAIGMRGLRVHNTLPPNPRTRRGGLAWTSQFECENGRWVFFMTGNTRTRDVAAAAGVSDWYERGMFDPARLVTDDDLAEEQAAAAPELFRTRTAQQWEDLVASAEGECAVCNSSQEWLHHPHALGSEIIIESEHPDLGAIRQPGLNVRLSESPGSIRWAAPRLDEHRDDVIGELDGLPAPAASAAASNLDATMRAALEGVKVLDLCIILAGPTCGRTLAEFGADVIKIDDPNRGTIVMHNDVNRGKRSILLDLKSEEGLATFWELVDGVDVVVQNYRKGAVDKLGIGYEEVRKRRPDIVYASLNAYGHVRPWADRPGHEQLGQAVTGMQRRFGGDGQPALQPFPVNDYGTGYMGAYGVALALLHRRRRTGQGQHVDSALAYTATMLQSLFLLDYEGKQWDEPSGQDTRGSGTLQRAYEASDGWLFVGAQQRDLARLDAVEGMGGVEGLASDALEQALESRFASEAVETWVGRLIAADIGASPVLMDSRDLMVDPWVIEHGLSVTREHDGLGPVTTTGPGPRLSRSPVRPGKPASSPGADAREVLSEFGLADRYEGLIESGAMVADGVTGR